MAFTEKPPQMPPPDQPVIDRDTGRMTAPWRNWLTAVLAYLERMGAAIP
jgi:hypothetical protein